MTQTSTPTPEKVKQANGASDYAKAKAKDIEAKATQVRRDAEEAIDATLTDAREQFETTSAQVSQAVRRNPAMALGAALGAGVLVGLLLRGRN